VTEIFRDRIFFCVILIVLLAGTWLICRAQGDRTVRIAGHMAAIADRMIATTDRMVTIADRLTMTTDHTAPITDHMTMATAHMEIDEPDAVHLNGLWGNDFPAHCLFAASKTSVVVGPYAVLTAAHVVTDGKVHSADGLPVKCWRHPEYSKNSTADLALCLYLGDSPIVRTRYETINLDPALIDKHVVLTGFGTVDDDNNWGLGIKSAAVSGKPANDGYYAVVNACLTGGDSGGPTFDRLDTGSRRIVGVNSKQCCTTSCNAELKLRFSLISSTSTKGAVSWFTEGWFKDRLADQPPTSEQKLKICGVNLKKSEESRCNV